MLLYGKLLYYTGAVGGVCHTKPTAVSVEHLNGSLTILNESIDAEGDEEFSLGSVDVLVKEALEFAFAIVEVVGSKAPKIH